MGRRSRVLLATIVPLAVAGQSCTDSIVGDKGARTGRPTAADPKGDAPVSPVLVRRLSQSELDSTLEDVLGDDTRPAQRLLLEDERNPYDNDYTLQKSSRAYTDAMREMARLVARRAAQSAQARSLFMTCQPQAAGDAACFRQTVLLCNDIADPPANVDVDQPPGNPDQECKTERYRAHMDQSGCRECHAQIDPVGLGLENFDIAGRWRDHDDGKPQCRIPGLGDVPGIGRFSGPKELADRLLAAGEISDCLVRQYATFALGRALAAEETPLVARLTKAMSDDGGKLVGQLRRLVTDPSFALRKEAK